MNTQPQQQQEIFDGVESRNKYDDVESMVIGVIAPVDIDLQLTTLDAKACEQSEKIRALTITGQDTYEVAVNYGRLIATAIAEWEKEKEERTGEAYTLVTRVRSGYNAAIKLAEADKQFLSSLCGAYDRAQKRAEEEQARLAKVESDRLEAERKLNAAVVAESAGMKPTAVERILTAPPTAMPVPTASVRPKVAGTSGRQYWKAYPSEAEPVCGDPTQALIALVKAAAAEPDRYLAFLSLNESAANAEAKKGELCKLPGYEARTESKTGFRKL